MVNGKAKGAGFEREVCKALSLWVSKGRSTDLFWRTAMSGGRATVQYLRGVKVRQVGDICSVSPEGHAFTEIWFVECKNVRDANLSAFLLLNKGPLAKFWKTARLEAAKHRRSPMVVIRARGPTLVVTLPGRLDATPLLTSHTRNCDVYLFSDVVQT